MWILLAIISALSLGVYDIFKKLSLRGNNVPGVLFLNTLFCSLLMLPVLVPAMLDGQAGPDGTVLGNLHILLKSAIVLSSWILGYYSIKHLPLTIAGPINAARPVIVLVGALLIFGERLNALQWAGVTLGFFSLFFISRIGVSEGFSFRRSLWLWLAIGATTMGAVSALYDKYLMTLYEPLQVQAWYSVGNTMHIHIPNGCRRSLFLRAFVTRVNDCRGVNAKARCRNSIVHIRGLRPARTAHTHKAIRFVRAACRTLVTGIGQQINKR